MTTIINTPASTTESGGSSFLVGTLILIAFITVLLYFGIPAIRRMGPVQVNIPATQINMPDKVDVTVTPTE